MSEAEDLDTRIKAYYKLKQKYDDNIKRQKMRIIRDTNLSIREKRARVRLIKNQCVKCKKEGGTIFTVKDRILRATCGNTTNPCDLDININRGDFQDIREVLASFKDKLEDHKEDIIRTKLDLLFNYVDESKSLERFNKLKKHLEQYSKPIDILTDSYLSIINNTKNKESIEDIDKNLFLLTEEIKLLANKFEDKDVIKDMVEIYISKITPLVKKRQELKYSKIGIKKEESQTEEIFRLIEEPYTLGDLLIDLDGV